MFAGISKLSHSKQNLGFWMTGDQRWCKRKNKAKPTQRPESFPSSTCETELRWLIYVSLPFFSQRNSLLFMAWILNHFSNCALENSCSVVSTDSAVWSLQRAILLLYNKHPANNTFTTFFAKQGWLQNVGSTHSWSGMKAAKRLNWIHLSSIRK